MDPRFIRNFPTLTEAEQAQLHDRRVFVAGCGGLGGFLLEFLTRAGVGSIVAADCDSFEYSNRNRQILSLESTLGQSKVLTAAARAKDIQPDVEFTALETRLDAENLPSLISGCDLVLDALDNIPGRLALEDACAEKGLYLIHGAVHGWAAQAAVVLPGSGLLHMIYADLDGKSDNSVLSPIPGLCAAVQCAEAIRLLTGRPSALAGKLLMMDLQAMEFTTVEF